MTNCFYLVGAGGFAREIYSYLSESEFATDGCALEGFLDDNPQALDNFSLDHKILHPLFSKSLPQNAKLLMAVANPALKQELYQFYKNLGYEFITFVHKSAFVGKSVSLGEGSVLAPNCTLTTDITIGSCVTINAHATVGHDARIGNFSTLTGHCDVTGFVELGNKVFMGSHSLIIPNVKVGDNATIGAGSVVITKVKPGITVFGNPARKIK
ncbi:acetyltransferase [Vibrio alginolyticus]|nr:acetyltransferase [Vibrio alginolyticus]